MHSGRLQRRRRQAADRRAHRARTSRRSRTGCANLEKHDRERAQFGLPVVVAINRFTTDTDGRDRGDPPPRARGGRRAAPRSARSGRKGGAGGEELARGRRRGRARSPTSFHFLYPLDVADQGEDRDHRDEDLRRRRRRLSARRPSQQIAQYTELGLRQAARSAWPRRTCRSRTTPTLKGRPTGFRVPIRDVRASVGRGLPLPAAAARCGRCPACRPSPRRGRSTSTTTATSSGCSEVRGAAEAGADDDGAGIEDDSVERYLAGLASAAPAPGGGSAAALAAALGAALVAMTCRVTVSTPAPRPRPARRARRRGRRRAPPLPHSRRRRACLLGGDRRPPITPPRSAPPPCRTRSSARRTCRAPCRGEPGRGLCERITPSARASTLSDLGVAALLAHGALRAATLTARTNLAGIADDDFTGGDDPSSRRARRGAHELAARIEAARAARAGPLVLIRCAAPPRPIALPPTP